MTQEEVEDTLKERARVIDHVKRLFAIVCGLAITVASTNAFTCLVIAKDWVGVLQYLATLFTIVPIFHGAERSLDLQYLRRDSGVPTNLRFITDIWILIGMALFFVAIAQTIPNYRPPAPSASEVAATHSHFFLALGLFFLFDVLGLAIGLSRQSRESVAVVYKQAHKRWMGLNFVMAVVCLTAWRYFDAALLCVSLVIAMLAIVRTALDYCVGWKFLYPDKSVEKDG